jgi:hypothetical protein
VPAAAESVAHDAAALATDDNIHRSPPNRAIWSGSLSIGMAADARLILAWAQQAAPSVVIKPRRAGDVGPC